MSLAKVERLWVHGISIEPSPGLLAWLRGGGRLLATLEAVELPWRLGLEPQPPDERRRGSWRDGDDEFRPDSATLTPAIRHARGFAAFGPHPLFRGFGNGALTWAPTEGASYGWLAYRHARPERGAGVAVERVGRTLHPPRWVAWEYQVGEGGILCLGAFAQLAPADQRLGAELRGLLANALVGDAIPHRTRDAPATHWPGPLPDEDDGAVVAAAERAPARLDEVWDDWPPTTSPILIESGAGEGSPWAFTGRRARVTGGEAGGVQEIWVHPYRVVRNARLLVNGVAPRVSLVRTAPDEIVRLLRAGEVELTERITAALEYGLVFWSIVADLPATISLRWETDLRRSAPYPPRTSLARVQDLNGTGMRVTLSHEAAAVEIIASAGTLTAQGVHFELRGDGPVRVIIAGAANEGELQRALGALERRKLRAFRQERTLHARRLEERLTALEAPDAALVRAFAWAKVRLDQSLAETPGVGRSVLTAETSSHAERARYLTAEGCRVARAALVAGDREITRDVLRFLLRGRDRSGRVPSEITTSGLAFHDAPESAAMLRALAAAYLAWTGDRAWLDKQWPGSGTGPRCADISSGAWDLDTADEALEALRRQAAAPAMAAELVRGVVEGLWGVEPDAEREALSLSPLLPDSWNEMSLRRLRVGATTLDLRLRRRPGRTVLRVERSHGPRLRLSASLRTPTPLLGLTLNDEPLGGSRAVFDLGAEDEVAWLIS